MKSLRLRLLLGTLIWIALTLVIAGFGLTKLFQQHLQHQLTSELDIHLDQLTTLFDLDAPSGLSAEPSDPRFNRPLSGLYWQIEYQQEVFRSRSLWDQKLTLPSAQEQLLPVVDEVGTPLLALVRDLQLDNEPLRLAIAIEESALSQPLKRFNAQLWRALWLLGLGLIVAVIIQVLLGLQPLKRLRQDLQQVRLGNHARLQGSYPSEIEPLVQEFNDVLQHNQESVERARTLAGNLSHALKTPLTVLANAAASEESEFAQLVATQVNFARTQADYHLSRARAAALRKVGSRAQIRPVLEGLKRVLAKVYADKTLAVSVHCPQELHFAGEEPELQEMLGNLLDNACKWANSHIEIKASQLGAKLYISIEDDGAGLSEEQKAQVLQRGIRADERTAGSGLGLSIVSELVLDYGGQLELHDSNLGGLKALLILPAAADNPANKTKN